MKIIADHREERSGIPQRLENELGIQVERASLSVGDYELDQAVVFERKTLADFIQSIIDGRLFRQAERLVSGSLKPALILEGTVKETPASRMSRESIQGALVSLGLIWGIPVLRSMGPDETARLMVYAGNQIDWIACGSIKRSGYRPKTQKKRQLFILQGLPGVGPERAEVLLNHFGSVAAVTSAAVHEMAALEGLGPKTAQAIYEAVHEERVGYESLLAGGISDSI